MRFLTDPWTWWIEPFLDSDSVQAAAPVVALNALCTALVGTWVVLRGMSFLGDALAHGVLPGIAVAFVLGGNTTLGAFVAAIAMVGGINVIRAASPLPDDASIGVLFVGFLSLAVVIMSSSRSSYAGDLNRFLFGSVTGVDGGDLTRQLVATAITVVGVGVFYRAFLVSTFDERQATLLGLHGDVRIGLHVGLDPGGRLGFLPRPSPARVGEGDRFWLGARGDVTRRGGNRGRGQQCARHRVTGPVLAHSYPPTASAEAKAQS